MGGQEGPWAGEGMTTYPPGSSPRPLPDGHEARDLLKDVLVKDGLCIAVFKFGPVALPPELEPRLRGMTGHEVACLRLDNKYYIRAVS